MRKNRRHFHILGRRSTFKGAKTLQNIHPASSQRVIRIHVNRMTLHQRTKILSPQLCPIKSLMDRIVKFNGNLDVFRWKNAAVVILIHISIFCKFLHGLRFFSGAEALNSFLIIHSFLSFIYVWPFVLMSSPVSAAAAARMANFSREGIEKSFCSRDSCSALSHPSG